MFCRVCRKNTPTCELVCYQGVCENCWVDRTCSKGAESRPASPRPFTTFTRGAGHYNKTTKASTLTKKNKRFM